MRFLAQAGILVQALPFMQRYQGEIVLIKFGGHAMVDDALFTSFARDVVLLKQVGVHPVVVHGGGPQINEMLERFKIKSEFIDGLRVSDADTVEVVAIALNLINKRIAAEINTLGGKAVGITGADANLLRAKPIDKKLGFAGTPARIDGQIIHDLLDSCDAIPVIAPLAVGIKDNQFYNVNADTAAGHIAAAVKARRLLMLTDVEGVLDANGERLTNLTIDSARALMQSGVIKGGMIPKLDTCIEALEQGLRAAVILDGRFTHSILLELFTQDGHGTLIRA